jgi:hypothetical protein
LEAGEISEADIESALEFRRDTLEGMSDPTFADMRHALETLKVKVTIDGDTALIDCLIPKSQVSIALCTD